MMTVVVMMRQRGWMELRWRMHQGGWVFLLGMVLLTIVHWWVWWSSAKNVPALSHHILPLSLQSFLVIPPMIVFRQFSPFHPCSSDHNLVDPSIHASLNYLIIGHSLNQHVICSDLRMAWTTLSRMYLLINQLSKEFLNRQYTDILIIGIILKQRRLLMEKPLEQNHFGLFQIELLLQAL